MRSSVWLGVLAGACVALGSCTDSFEPTGSAVPPDSVVAKALGMRSVRITWFPSEGAAGYVIQRRANLTGTFTSVTHLTSAQVRQYVDDSLTPETIYGYRVVAQSYKGVDSKPSLVAETRTAPWPGILASVATNPLELGPANGYGVIVARGGDTVSAALASLDEHRFGPLSPGTYHVTLTGVQANCNVSGGAERTVTVTDQGLGTLQYASYSVPCRDPSRGSLTVNVATTGDSLDADGYILTLSGVADDATLPDSQRGFYQEDVVGVQALRQYASLRPGSYTVELTGLATNCTVQGSTSLSLHLSGLDDLSRSFTVVCPAADDPTRPFTWRSRWSSPTAPVGSRVSLDVSYDLSRQPGQRVADVQATLRYSATVVQLDSVRRVSPWTVTANEGPVGTVAWLAFVTGSGLADSTTFARFYFTVIGAVGSETTTGTSIIVAEDALGTNLIPHTRKTEDTFTVASGSPGNAPPVARPGGPYSGTAGTPVGFNGSTSSDPDGSLSGWSWTFGDGGTGTGMTPAHTYAAAGTYTVTLTVTDNGGLTASATATATIAPGGGGGNQAPIALANGPYNGVIGTPVAFSAAGSSDPDGTIASYAWNFGDGGTAAGATPTHSYATAAAFTVTLTVTDNLGATGSTTTTATIVPGGGPRPFTWRSDFGPVSPTDSLVTLTITLDLSTNIPETPVVEALSLWRVDSLRWDPTVLQYLAFDFGPEGAGSVNPTDALTQGTLLVGGVQGAYGSTGVVTIALIMFKVLGASGASTTTATSLGQLQGTVATGSFNYGPYTSVLEGALQAP